MCVAQVQYSVYLFICLSVLFINLLLACTSCFDPRGSLRPLSTVYSSGSDVCYQQPSALLRAVGWMQAGAGPARHRLSIASIWWASPPPLLWGRMKLSWPRSTWSLCRRKEFKATESLNVRIHFLIWTPDCHLCRDERKEQFLTLPCTWIFRNASARAAPQICSIGWGPGPAIL